MAVGLPMKTTYANGDVYSASDVNDTNGTINLIGQTTNLYAAKNRIINGDFRFNQRNFTSVTTTDTYGFDRFMQRFSGACTYTPQTFTPGTAPVAPYEAINFARLVSSSQVGSSDFATLLQRIEDVRTFANQTVTMSFWAKASTGTPNIGVTLSQVFGSGGSATVNTSPAVKTITSSWARYSFQITLPSISGKTIGTGSYLEAFIFTSCGTSISASGYAAVGLQNVTVDIWGVQVEAGSAVSAFQTASGSIAGELSLCQRYYYRVGGLSVYQHLGMGNGATTTIASILINNPTTMRVAPTSVDYSTLALFDATVVTGSVVPTVVAAYGSNNIAVVDATVASGLTVNRFYKLLTNNSTSGYIGFSAEL